MRRGVNIHHEDTKTRRTVLTFREKEYFLRAFVPSWLIVFLLALAFPLSLEGQTAPPQAADSGVSLTDAQWKAVVTQFEESVLDLSHWLGDNRAKMDGLQSEIRKLEEKTARLRAETRDGSGVLDEIRLKSLLNDLKDKLQENSDLQHQWDQKRKEFEQKALSLISLYNDRISSDLQTDNSFSQPSQLKIKLDELMLLSRKRSQIQALLKQYQTTAGGENLPPLGSFGELKSDDRESLTLTLDLLRDRKKDLEEQLGKWSIEEDQIKNELKLQGKMQEFLEDIQRVNEDSSFPHSSLKRSDLSDMAGDKERRRLEARLVELRQMTVRGQASLDQINQFIEIVQNHLNSLGKGGSK